MMTYAIIGLLWWWAIGVALALWTLWADQEVQDRAAGDRSGFVFAVAVTGFVAPLAVAWFFAVGLWDGVREHFRQEDADNG